MAGEAGEVWFSIFPVNEESKSIVNDVRNQDHAVIVDGAGAAASKVIQVVFRDYLKPNCSAYVLVGVRILISHATHLEQL